MHKYIHTVPNTDPIDVSIAAERLAALRSVYQFDYNQIENSSHQYGVVHDVASDDRAEKCSVRSSCYHRRRYLFLHTTTTTGK